MTVLSLIIDDWICQKVAAINHIPVPNYLRMHLTHEPPNVSKEEASFSIRRIGISLAELVMNSMVSSPMIDIILMGK